MLREIIMSPDEVAVFRTPGGRELRASFDGEAIYISGRAIDESAYRLGQLTVERDNATGIVVTGPLAAPLQRQPLRTRRNIAASP